MSFKKKKNKEYALHSQTNTYAILSLIFGILFFIPFGPILAIIFGFLALGQIKHTGEPGRGMAISGIVLGFFWILLFLLLILVILLALTTTVVALLPTMMSQ
jgi:hypothetical protein